MRVSFLAQPKMGLYDESRPVTIARARAESDEPGDDDDDDDDDDVPHTVVRANVSMRGALVGARARVVDGRRRETRTTRWETRCARAGDAARDRRGGRRASVVARSNATIKVLGCGGGGGNAVNRMISGGLQARVSARVGSE